MDLFVIDTDGDTEKKDNLLKKKLSFNAIQVDAIDYGQGQYGYYNHIPKHIRHSNASANITNTCVNLTNKKSDEEKILNCICGENGNPMAGLTGLTFTNTNVKNELKYSALNDIDKKESVAYLSNRKLAKLKMQQKSTNKGKNWYNMTAPDMTEEIKRDVQIIQMRSVLNRKHFYKKNDFKVLPKIFQVGKVLPSALDYYNDRNERITKKKTIVDELLLDVEFQRYNKRKYKEIVDKQQKSRLYKAHQ